jgi:hypothetical protein
MLTPSPRVSKVVVEHRGVDAVDDVVVYYAPPGVNDRGATVRVDFHQLKFHVAKTGTVDHDALVDPVWTGTKVAMLRRFADAWTRIAAEHASARLSLVTNWPWNPTSSLAPLIRDGGHLSDAFLTAGHRSAVGRIRKRWIDACALSENDFATFVKTLRLSTSAVSQEDSELWLSDRCQLAGLVPIAPGVDHSPYDDLGARLIESGRTEHTPASLRDLVEKQGLVATKDVPFKSTFAVRSFSRFAHVPETDGACVVDLTDLFDGRRAQSADAWDGAIRERLEAALPKVGSLAAPVHVALDAHLSIAWYAGYLLNPKSGVRVLLRQATKGKGIDLWDVSTSKQPTDAASWVVTASETGEGDELAIAISVTHGALTDVARFVDDSLPNVGTVLHAVLPDFGPQVVRDGAHARWLADELIKLLSAQTAVLRPTHVHIFPACPESLAFLLGQEGRALGPTTVYEYELGSATRTYVRGMTTTTMDSST